MSTDVADLLHESIDRLTREARAPDGMADRVLRRNHQRRMTLGMAVASGTAVLATAAVFVATTATGGVPHAGRPRPPQTTTAAYVLSHTERALATAERRGLIQEVHAAARGFEYALLPGVPKAAPQAVFWSVRGQFREAGFTAGGRPLFDGGARYVPPGQRRMTQGTAVDYGAKTWWRVTARQQIGPAPSMQGCGGVVPAPDSMQPNSPPGIRRALSCSGYRLAGRQWIDGIRTIKIAGVGSKSIQTFWVDPATYLPVRVRVTWPPRRGMPYTMEVGDFRWLTPTTAHLATLQVPVPSGFRRVPDRCGLVGFGRRIARHPCLPQIGLAIGRGFVAVASGP